MGERFAQGHALIVGVGGDLPHTVGDAVGLADILKDTARCAYPPSQVYLLTGENATREHILAALDALSQSTGAQSTLLVYFSGHGYRVSSPTGRFHYLLPHGYDLNHLHQTAVSGAEFADQLRAIPAHKLLLLLDCCHARGVGQAKAPGLQLQLAKSPLPPEAQQLLAEGSGRVLVASSQENELSFAGRPYSAFTLALIEALCGTGVAKQDGYVRVADLALHAREAVPGRTGGRQHPILHFEHADNFVLATYAGGETQPKGVPLATEPEIEPEPGAWTVALDQRGQTVHGPQTVVAGDVYGPVLSGEFGGPVAVAGGEAVDLRGAQTIVYKPTIQQAPALEIPPPPQPTPPPSVTGFVGREAELAYFADKLTTSHLAVICGMPGVGKTALAAVLARRIGDPHKTFWHTFHEGEGIEGVVWKLAGFLWWHGQAELWHMLQGAQRSGGEPPPPAMLFDYLFQMLRGHGYLLCFDDLHFVEDDPLLEGFLQRTRSGLLAGDLALIVASQCVPAFVDSDEFAPLTGLSLNDTVDLFARHGFPVREVGKGEAKMYSTPGLYEMQDLTTSDLIANLHARTEGNALFLTQAVDAFKHTSAPVRFLIHMSESDDIERFLAKEIDDSLTEDERAVMSAVAVLQGHAGTREAIEALLDGQNVRRILRSLHKRHLLHVSEGEAGREYSMNAIVRYFYYDLLSKRERQAMHRRAGAFYETEEPDLLKAARHFYEASEHKRAARLATVDVRALINQGQARALRHLLGQFTARQIDTAQWAEVNIARGQVHTLLGDGQAARDSYQDALSELAGLPQAPEVSMLRAHAYRGMGELLHRKSPKEALDCLRRGLDQLAGASTSLEADLYIKMGSIHTILGDYTAALRDLEKGLNLLPEDPNRLRAGALNNLGTIYCIQGDIERGKDYYLGALEIDQQLHDYWGMVETWHNLAIEMEIAGDWADAAAQYQQALALAEQLGSPHQRAREELSLGILRTNQGDYEAARAHLSGCLEIARDHGLRTHLIYIQPSMADLHLRQGEPEAAQPLLAEAEQLALETGVREQLPEICRLWAQVLLAKGQPAAALARAERSLNLARDLEDGLEEGAGMRVLGQALLADGQHRPAMEAFAQSLSFLADRDPYEAARTKMQWGLALISSSADAGRGRELLSEARATFEELGARRDAAAVDQALAGILEVYREQTDLA